PVHRELVLPNPSFRPNEFHRELSTLSIASAGPLWLELHRKADGEIRFYLGAPASPSLNHSFNCLLDTHPGLQLGHEAPCAATRLALEGAELWRARHLRESHFWPLRLSREADRSGSLIRSLQGGELDGQEFVLQILFQRRLAWESSFWGVSYDTFREQVDRSLHPILARRKAEPVYHVEIRAASLGGRPDLVWEAVQPWVCSWTSFSGGSRWALQVVGGRKRPKFYRSFVGHDISRFAGNPSERDISGSDLACVLPLAWKDHHPGLRYVGAPQGQIPKELLASGLGIVLGSVGSQAVQLPAGWNHLAVLGRTQTGKSSLALNLVTEVMSKKAGARVVVMEPTGELIRGIETRMKPEWASEVVEVDPAHPTFELRGAAFASVPFNPLALPETPHSSSIERERQQEVVIGGILEAFRTAWGAESIGGRAEFLLRAILQGLLSVERSNLVDAYYLLSDRQALNRFVRTLPQGPVRAFLETHLPRLDYPITISSLDKLGKIATNPLLRIALCQRSSPVGFDRLLGSHLLLLNLSKGALGADGANFLGAIYLSQLWGTLQRTGRPDKPVYLVIDEAQNYPVQLLSEMLSEGRKFGLHLVLVTQFLDRMAEGLREALLGNVDAWAFFPLGVEDATTAWKVANGERFRWTTQDFVAGLNPRQFGLALPGVLLKVDANPVGPAARDSEEVERLVHENSRRFAQPEDSRVSPWMVGQSELEAVLKGLEGPAVTVGELATKTGLPADLLEAGVARGMAIHDILRSPDGPLSLSRRGLFHFAALSGRRHEGEEHVETLTDFAAFLDSRGISLTIPDQVGGILLPDGEFRWGGSTYNVEVECSTLVKAQKQAVRNVRKGVEAHRRVLVVLPEQSRVPAAMRVLSEALPGLRLWSGPVGLVWRDGSGEFVPHDPDGTEVWPFLDREFMDTVGNEPLEPTPTIGQQRLIVEVDPLVNRVTSLAEDMVGAGQTEATSRDILDRLGNPRPTDEQVGTVLGILGARSKRVRLGGSRLRVYDLSSIHPEPNLDPDRIVVDQSNGPEPGPGVGDANEEIIRWSKERSPEDDRGGPA
ncbi:MAG TPA: hypothetical protein VKT21_00190, partial [Thermoplasmata archaeon]|nr:hypothetical protein [Thermoplasmata archaeon]